MNKSNGKKGIVYSTNPEFHYEGEEEEVIETLIPEKQKLKVLLDNKHRGGKTVTLVTNFVGSENDLIQLSKILKTYCGTGGSAKDGEIIIQGNAIEKVKKKLIELNYRIK